LRVKVLDKETRITNPYKGSAHTGVDLGRTSQPMTVLAHGSGEVIIAVSGKSNNKGSTGNESYGNFIKIKHDNYYTLYAHLRDVYVSVGNKVNEKEAIGTMGESGNAYGVHLHFEVFDKNNIRVNPESYLDDSNIVDSGDSSETQEIVYTVVKGDNLSKIARQYNTTWQKIYSNNRGVIGSNPDLIYPDQKLVIKDE